MKLLVKKLYPDSQIPIYGNEFAAGLDLSAYGEHWIQPRERKVIPTGIAVQWVGSYLDEQIEKPSDYYLRIAPRSGLSVKNSIDIGAGVIDCDYRGEIKICFINNSNDTAYHISHGDRIGQGILERIKRFDVIEQVEQLDLTDRNEGGFGSTGK